MAFKTVRLGCAVAFAAIGSLGQDLPKFEVTSVKPNRLDARQLHREFGCSANGRFVSLGERIRTVVLWAFDIQGYRLVGFPPWADAVDARFDIEAKADGSVTESQCKLMVQGLLGNRFKFSAHREPRATSVYALVVDRGGAKLKRSTEYGIETGVKITINGRPVQVGPGSPNRPDEKSQRGWPMERLAGFLSGQPFVDARPVLDRTGLEGFYEFTLDFAFTPTGGVGAAPADSSDVFAAIQQQLGLRLEDRKEPMETLVVDHLEKPNEN